VNFFLKPDPSIREESGFVVWPPLPADGAPKKERQMKRARVLLVVAALALGLLAAPRARGEEPAASATASPGTASPGTTSSSTPRGAGAQSTSKLPAPAAKSNTASNAQSSKAAAGNKTATSKAQEQKLKPVVVTATRIEEPLANVGTTVTVVEDSQIESQKIQSVETVLRQLPGVTVTQSGSPGSLTDVSIRGATPAQTLVLIDGVEVNTGGTGEFDFANLTTDNIDRIEVLRGAGGSLYGSQAIGGVVNVLTPEGEGPAKVSMLSEGGNRATQDQVLTVNGADGKLGYSGALSYFSTQGFRPVNDSSDNLSGSFRLDYHLDDDTVFRGFARYSAANVSLVNFSNSSGVNDPTAHQRTEFMLFKGEVEHHFGERLLGRASAFFVRDDLRLNSTPFKGSTSTLVDHIPDEIRGGNLEAVYTWAEGFRTLAGFDFLDRWIRTDELDIFPPFAPSTTAFNARRQEYAGYLEQEGSFFNGHLLATGGFRVDGNSEFGKEVSPAWSVAIPIQRISTTLRGSYSEGFRAPSFDELFFPDFGNPKLAPEISSEYDGGFTTNFGEMASLTTTYFSRRVHDLIVSVPCPTCVFGSIAGNAGRVDTQGVEVVPSITPIRGLTFSGNVTILDETHVSSSAIIRPLRVPKHSAAALLQYIRGDMFSPHDRFTASLAYMFVGDRDDITVESTIQNHSAYHRLDAVASYALGAPFRRIRDEEIFARVRNLTDRHYSEAFGFPAPQINFVAGIKLDLE